jgi:hypothetical protein
MIKITDVFSVPSSRNETKRVLFVIKELDKMRLKYEVDNFGNISVVKGISETYPMFCAHLDTVHDYPNGYNLIQEPNKLSAKDDRGFPVGVGGDDSSGIYICLKLLEKLPFLKVVFFSREETGGIGSKNFNTSFFSNVRFIGSIDRKGAKDFASSHGGVVQVSKKFLEDIQPILTKYKREEVVGGFTDAFNVSAAVSCFNMSCGYYSPHTCNEYIDIAETEATYEFCLDIVRNLKKVYCYTKPTPSYPTFNYNTWRNPPAETYYPKNKKNKDFPAKEWDTKTRTWKLVVEDVKSDYAVGNDIWDKIWDQDLKIWRYEKKKPEEPKQLKICFKYEKKDYLGNPIKTEEKVDIYSIITYGMYLQRSHRMTDDEKESALTLLYEKGLIHQTTYNHELGEVWNIGKGYAYNWEC